MPTRQAERSGAAHASPSVPAVRRGQIAGSKLSAPPLRPGIVERRALLDVLGSATHAPVVLLSAPAGYGKTTLLSLWREQDGRPFAWVSLDASDDDPVAFVAAMVAALDGVVELDPAIGEALRVRRPPLTEVVLPSLADACAASRGRFVLVLDDVHLVSEPRCHTATRADPGLPLASWRAHGRLAELRAAELALADAEAQALLSAAGVRLSGARVARLVERTEGWPAALYLAALSLRGHSDPEGFVDRFAGTSRHVADFLSEDVLARQPEPVINFLLRTCVLEELTASLCDTLTGGANADAMLRELERGNLLVVPLDEERRAYRYHHLFAQYLRAELTRREPDLVPELHRRASSWHRDHGSVARAIDHAQAAGDVDVAATLVATHWSALSQHGQVETVRKWLAGFADAQIEGHAPLAIAAAWTAALTGERERAARFAEAARRGSWEGAMPDGTASLESALAIMSSAFGLDGVSRMRSVAQRAVELEPETSLHRATAVELFGIACALEGDFAAARAALIEAVDLSGAETSTGALSLAHLAVIGLHEGNEEEAFDYAQAAHAVVRQPRMRADLASVGTYSVVAHLLACRDDLEGAAAAVDHAKALLPRLTGAFWWLMIETRILLAPVLVALGSVDEARRGLDEVAALLAAHPDAGRLPEWHAEAVRKLRPHPPLPSQALTDAERRILRLLASDLTLREIGRELYLSLNTVKTHTHSIYRKLGVSSRAQAVEAARRDSPG